MTRMSDVFELPVREQDVGVIVLPCMADDHSAHDAAVVHAVNTHDKLLDLLTYAVKHTVIDTSDSEQMRWFIDALEILEGEL